MNLRKDHDALAEAAEEARREWAKTKIALAESEGDKPTPMEIEIFLETAGTIPWNAAFLAGYKYGQDQAAKFVCAFNPIIPFD